MTARIALNNVSRVHGEGHTAVVALNDVTFSVEPGEMVAVMGPSGSGKTTLLSLVGGLDFPTSGTVTVEGFDLGELSVSELAQLRRRRIGYVFQQYNLIDVLTAAENVALPLDLDGIDPDYTRQAVGEALDSVGLASLADRFPDDLSGGEQQRVAIARAVVAERTVVLADEPTGALDSVTGENVLRMLRERCETGTAVVLVTHDPRFAAWADRIVFLRDGRIADESAPSGVGGLLVIPNR